MTLPNEEVMDLLRERFVLGHRNIERDLHVGLSHGYRDNQSAVATTNGAGGRNLQLLVMAADEVVLHALPGFWHAEDLLPELRLALEVHRLHQDDQLDEARRRILFRSLHRAHLATHGAAAAARGDWQDFDRHFEMGRAQSEPRDTVVGAAGGEQQLKTIPQLVHERLMMRPFRRLAEFDLGGFVDYGRPYYDNNPDEGREFPRAERANEKREQLEQKAREAAAKAATKASKGSKRSENAQAALRSAGAVGAPSN